MMNEREKSKAESEEQGVPASGGQVSSEQTLEGSEGMSHMDIWGESIPSNDIKKCKGPEADCDHRCNE